MHVGIEVVESFFLSFPKIRLKIRNPHIPRNESFILFSLFFKKKNF